MFKLKIKTGGSAYRYENDSNPVDLGGGVYENHLDPNATELRRNLKDICVRLENGYTDGKVYDIYGNSVGEWTLE